MNARRKRALNLATVLVGLSFVLPWFTFERDLGSYTHKSWALIYMRRCSDFAHAIECRTKLFTDRIALHWDLIPLWTLTQLVAIAACMVLLGALVAKVRRESTPGISRVAAGALLAFVSLIAAVPGDDRFPGFEPSWGALFGLLGATLAFVASLEWESFTPTTLRRRSAMILAALCVLSSLWFQWVYQPEAIAPTDPDEQHAYSYGVFADRHHWHDIRAEREHYWGEDIRSLEPSRLARDLDTVTAIAAGAAGFVLAALLLFGVTTEPSHMKIRAAMAVFVVLGATFPFLMRGSIPGPGVVLALIGVVLTGWALRRRDGPETF